LCIYQNFLDNWTKLYFSTNQGLEMLILRAICAIIKDYFINVLAVVRNRVKVGCTGNMMLLPLTGQRGAVISMDRGQPVVYIGLVVIKADRDLVVGTKFGSVHIPAGAQVQIEVTADQGTCVTNLASGRPVQIHATGKSNAAITLEHSKSVILGSITPLPARGDDRLQPVSMTSF
jgi:hypothetical protein